MGVAITVQRLTLDVLHHEVGQSVFSCSTVEESRYVRVIESGEYLSFFAEATEDKVSIHTALDELDRRPFIEFVIGTRGFVHSAHATSTDLTFDTIGTETPPEHGVFVVHKRLQHSQFGICVQRLVW